MHASESRVYNNNARDRDQPRARIPRDRPDGGARRCPDGTPRDAVNRGSRRSRVNPKSRETSARFRLTSAFSRKSDRESRLDRIDGFDGGTCRYGSVKRPDARDSRRPRRATLDVTRDVIYPQSISITYVDFYPARDPPRLDGQTDRVHRRRSARRSQRRDSVTRRPRNSYTKGSRYRIYTRPIGICRVSL